MKCYNKWNTISDNDNVKPHDTRRKSIEQFYHHELRCSLTYRRQNNLKMVKSLFTEDNAEAYLGQGIQE